ncbi:FHA domain-containing protein [Rhodococcus opacus]|uniref:Signal transduction protein n=2 Tax=Rhodococcus opacus TaxID=37919 RepID=K8XDH8_RHOOP|nr:FHA domain-containing protein [Rhodococcus opacus]EKT78911.1 signal transduction protein [Rhodococcus opacus M213]MDJ0418820.1 FHA domain-containing protein [Rhodococcus opacus]MDV6245125.1 FHA domain-containing protein [Rhodococcus opacus]MDV7088857.1 FHA domain-containing protein [Rhodococcus opacus]WKN60090.1 FHA domain-containing protein [Rhodococcus opacus]
MSAPFDITDTIIGSGARAGSGIRDDAHRLLRECRAKAALVTELSLDGPLSAKTYAGVNLPAARRRRHPAASEPPWGRDEVEALPSGSALLVVTRGPNRGEWFLLDQPVTTIGRHIDSDIYLDDTTVGRRHAQIRCDNDTFRVTDVGSLNGTYRNRAPVDTALLADGDEIKIGKFRLAFLITPPSAATDQ